MANSHFAAVLHLPKQAVTGSAGHSDGLHAFTSANGFTGELLVLGDRCEAITSKYVDAVVQLSDHTMAVGDDSAISLSLVNVSAEATELFKTAAAKRRIRLRVIR